MRYTESMEIYRYFRECFLRDCDTAKKLLGHGVSWAIITSATGVKPEDLQQP